jgi:tripartite motif-containing protein 71
LSRSTDRLLVALGIALVAGLLVYIFAYRPFSSSWDGRFQDPEGLAIDEAGNLYVADEDPGTIFMLDPAGNVMARADFLPGTQDRLSRGDGMVVLAPGRIIAIGTHRLHEVELLPSGPRVVRTIGERGSGPGQIEDAEGIARDENGRIWITDEDNLRIQIFAPDGAFAGAWTVPAEPEGICLWKSRVYVTFSKDNWVGCFSRDGKLELRFGKKGSAPGEFRVPDYACFSPAGELYITDQKNDRIQVFDAEGHFLFLFGGSGSAPGKFRDPEDIVFDRDGNVIVADGGNSRVQVLSKRGEPIRVIR